MIRTLVDRILGSVQQNPRLSLSKVPRQSTTHYGDRAPEALIELWYEDLKDADDYEDGDKVEVDADDENDLMHEH